MTDTIEIPSIDDFIAEGDDITDNVKNLSKTISTLLKDSPENYSKKIYDFFKSTLLSIWNTILTSPYPSRPTSLTKEISTFTEKYCLLCVHTNLIPSMVLAIYSTFDNSFRKGLFNYKVDMTLTEETIDNILESGLDDNNSNDNNNNDSILLSKRPSAEDKRRNIVLTPLICQIVQSRMFKKTKELFLNDELTIEQISAIDQLFSCIESSINSKIVSAILPMLVDITINLINTKYLYPNTKPAASDDTDKNYLPKLCNFLSTFAQMIPQPDIIDSILKILYELSGDKRPFNMRLNSISGMIHVIETVGIGNSAEMVKDAMINALTTSSQSSILDSVCNFLPKLAKETEFDDNDLHNLLLRAINSDDKLVSALIDVVNTLERNIDQFANELANYEILSPTLYCLVIGKTQNEDITRKLFNQLLSLTDKLMVRKGAIAHVDLNDRIKKHMNEEGVDLVKLLTFLFLCAPNAETIPNLIIRIFNLQQIPEDLIPVLKNSSRKLNDFDSVQSIIALFNVLIELLKKEELKFDKNPHNHFIDSLVQVVTQWIRTSQQINSETSQILKQLSELNFSQINDYVISLANELISKCNIIKSNIDFLFKVLNDTVPPKHANWLICSIFTLIHSNDELVSICYNIIIDHLQSLKNNESENKNRFINGVYLLYNAVTFEADYFMVGEQNNGFVQNIKLHLQNDSDTYLTVSLHPFHSTRRIFAEVANAMNIETDQFQLMLNDEEEKLLKFNAPLETISTLGFFNEESLANDCSENDSIPIELLFRKNEDLSVDYPITPNPKAYLTPFLNLLAPKISILFDLLEYHDSDIDLDFERRILFLIIKLFPQLHIDPKTILQEVIVGRLPLEKAILFKDCLRVFPYAVACSTNNYIKEMQLQQQQLSKKTEDSQDNNIEDENENKKLIIKQFIIELASHRYDIVSLSIACSALNSLKLQFGFDKEEMKKCLLDCQSQHVRIMASNLTSPTLTNESDFIELLDFALMKENRTKSKPFFDCLSKSSINREIFVPFYQKLEQFEFSFYSEIDQTFISLLSLIPQTPETVELTMKRLFSPPTCHCEIVPFVHTIESWVAALKFIETSLAISKLHSLIFMLPKEISQAKLSSDYTFKGRIGIGNMGSTCYMNALLQLLNSFQRVSLSITSKDTKNVKNMTPFILELRNCLAKLRYLRGSVLSLSELAKTINPKFNPTLQQDIAEFFNDLVDKIHDELKDEDDITNLMKIQISYNISVENEIVSSTPDISYICQLQTKNSSDQSNISNLSDAFDLYFKDENIEYTLNNEKVPAKRWVSINKWPDYLVIQLQRWEFIYTLRTNGKRKLVHEFDFPVELKAEDIKTHHDAQKCDSDYTLSGVAIHKGTDDQGHYVCIVLGDDNEWYFCNDDKIQYFDINNLASFTFGQSPDDSQASEDVYTGYLLFYKKVGLKNVRTTEISVNNQCFLPEDLEQEIDQANAKNWPSKIFFSSEFVNFARRMIISNPKDLQMLDIAFTVLFKIAICDEITLSQWCYLMNNQILNKNKNDDDKSEEMDLVYNRFFDYIENEVGNSLAQVFAISEIVTNNFSNLINAALSKVPNSTKPIRSILKCVPDQQFLKRMFCLFLFNTISSAIQILRNNVKWSEEDETLTMMLNILSIQLSKEVQRQISKQHVAAMNNVLGLFIDYVRVKGCTETVLNVFDVTRLNKINYIYKNCENFNMLMLTVNSIQADFFYEMPDATPATLELLSQILPQQASNENDSNEQLVLDLSFFFPSAEELVFCPDQKVRIQICECLMEMVGKQSAEMINYFKEALIKEKYTPILKEENTIALFVIGQFPKMQSIIEDQSYSYISDAKDNNNNSEDYSNDEDINYPNEAICIEFADVILRICCVTPNVLLNEFRSIVNMFLSSKHGVLKRKLLRLVHHIIAFDKSIINDPNYEDLIDQIMNSNVTSPYATQLLWAFQEKANGSILSGACVEYYLTSDYDENTEILINLLKKEWFKPCNVEIPTQASDFIKLRIANELWNVWPEKRNELSVFMLSAFDHAKPFSFYLNNSSLSTACKILSEFCKDELNAKIEKLKKEPSILEIEK
ncbi:hypothetical protein M9Y10_009010 [Tritrichomonas musculus]|uniref:USP domain-containing protein n=1 Tax=Tritrichomonas musculus TaxID=1915356 RepID=A0ABR2J0H1_9EUKA